MTITKQQAADHDERRSAAALPTARKGIHRRPNPSAFQQWRALTGRTVWTMIRHGDLAIAVFAPLVFTIGFYLPLRFVMKLQGIDYAQFLMPIIVLQAMAFTSISASQRASTESLTGFTARLKTMPVAAAVPLLSRMSSAFVQAVVSVTAALCFGYVIGFRFSAGVGQAVLFCLTAVAIGVTFSFGADAIGTLSKTPEAVSQALTLPQLILGMLSCGFVPETGFPEWIRPFVRNQPISQFSYALRDMAEGGVSTATLLPAAAWGIGWAVVVVPLAVWASLRRK